MPQFPSVLTADDDCLGCAAALHLIHKAGEEFSRPVLVGISGPGGTGKSSFTEKLVRQLGDARVLPLDDYRKPRAERRPGIYGSHPEGNQVDLLKSHLDAVRNALPFERPVFCLQRGVAVVGEIIHPARFILADGEIAAHHGLRDEFDVHIHLLAGLRLQWQARMGRDRRERRASLRKALTLFCISNLLDYPRYSAGMKDAADLVLRRSRCGRLLRVNGG